MEKSPKSWMTTLLLMIFFGAWAHLYVGKVGGFFLRFFTGYGCLILWVMDLIKMFKGTFTDGQGRVISKN